MLNRVTLAGNLGRDPELAHTPGGRAVTNLSVATHEAWTDKEGQPTHCGLRIEDCGLAMTAGEQGRRGAWGALGQTRGRGDGGGTTAGERGGRGAGGAALETRRHGDGATARGLRILDGAR
jgi:hypothetical protein